MSLIRPRYLPLHSIPDRGVLAAVFFGITPPDVSALAVRVPIPQLGGRLAEVWLADGEISRESRDGVAMARADDVLFGTIRLNDARPDEAAKNAYDALVSTTRSAGYPHLWRIWNHVGGINEEVGGLERYKLFSAGRHEALTRHGYQRERFPAASAVGMSEAGLLVYFIAGRREGVQAENPRQVSAYDYPLQYGPRSPSFSRATIVDDLIFVSGTASVVGHESRHFHSVESQLRETMENLDVTLAAAASAVGRTASARDLTVAKIYVRAGAEHEALTSRLRAEFPESILLQSDICRRELLLEIEGVAILPNR